MLLSGLLASSPVVSPQLKSSPNLSISSFFPKYYSSHIIPQFQTPNGSLELIPVPAVLPWGIHGLLQYDPKAFHLLLRKHTWGGSTLNAGPCSPATCLPFTSARKPLSLSTPVEIFPAPEGPCQRRLPLWNVFWLPRPQPNAVLFSLKRYSKCLQSGRRALCIVFYVKHSLSVPACPLPLH